MAGERGAMGLSVLQKWIVEGRALGVNKTGVFYTHKNKPREKDIKVINRAALPTLATSLASDMAEAFFLVLFLLMILLFLIFIRHYKDAIAFS